MDRAEVADPLRQYRWFHAARAELQRRLRELGPTVSSDVAPGGGA